MTNRHLSAPIVRHHDRNVVVGFSAIARASKRRGCRAEYRRRRRNAGSIPSARKKGRRHFVVLLQSRRYPSTCFVPQLRTFHAGVSFATTDAVSVTELFVCFQRKVSRFCCNATCEHVHFYPRQNVFYAFLPKIPGARRISCNSHQLKH